MLEKCDVKSLDQNVFSLIGEQWMLITAGTTERCNTMTASWGGLGVLWGSDVATCYIRPQRYTYEFVEGSDFFTLSFFGPEYRQALAFMENGTQRAYRPGGGQFGTEMCGGNLCLPLCCLWSLCNGGGFLCCPMW